MAERLSPIHQEIVDQLPLLRAMARALTRNPPEADDLVQETLTKAITHIDKFAPGTNLRAWLCTIERNTFYTNYHRKAREPLLDVEHMPGVCVQAPQEWSAKLRAVDGAMRELPVDQREALMLVGGIGMSYEEAAEVCDCALGTIKSRVSRGRTALLQQLDATDERDFLEEPTAPAVPHVIGGSPLQE
ncbi:MAG: sigma-70 family RNA polymerase sigma factor [Alphaproteobacteria bacterium]|nr:sigma-70 family RNA polymerase sigma factor [Alphaproteobacteria bacterium]